MRVIDEDKNNWIGWDPGNSQKLHLPVKRLLSTIFVWNMDETHPQGREKLDSGGTPDTEILHLPPYKAFLALISSGIWMRVIE
jgi:hypothetical protein